MIQSVEQLKEASNRLDLKALAGLNDEQWQQVFKLIKKEQGAVGTAIGHLLHIKDQQIAGLREEYLDPLSVCGHPKVFAKPVMDGDRCLDVVCAWCEKLKEPNG